MDGKEFVEEYQFNILNNDYVSEEDYWIDLARQFISDKASNLNEHLQEKKDRCKVNIQNIKDLFKSFENESDLNIVIRFQYLNKKDSHEKENFYKEGKLKKKNNNKISLILKNLFHVRKRALKYPINISFETISDDNELKEDFLEYFFFNLRDKFIKDTSIQSEKQFFKLFREEKIFNSLSLSYRVMLNMIQNKNFNKLPFEERFYYVTKLLVMNQEYMSDLDNNADVILYKKINELFSDLLNKREMLISEEMTGKFHRACTEFFKNRRHHLSFLNILSNENKEKLIKQYIDIENGENYEEVIKGFLSCDVKNIMSNLKLLKELELFTKNLTAIRGKIDGNINGLQMIFSEFFDQNLPEPQGGIHVIKHLECFEEKNIDIKVYEETMRMSLYNTENKSQQLLLLQNDTLIMAFYELMINLRKDNLFYEFDCLSKVKAMQNNNTLCQTYYLTKKINDKESFEKKIKEEFLYVANFMIDFMNEKIDLLQSEQLFALEDDLRKIISNKEMNSKIPDLLLNLQKVENFQKEILSLSWLFRNNGNRDFSEYSGIDILGKFREKTLSEKLNNETEMIRVRRKL